MREEIRRERQRRSLEALYERFTSNTGEELAQPSAPELTGSVPPAPAAGDPLDTSTRFMPSLAALDAAHPETGHLEQLEQTRALGTVSFDTPLPEDPFEPAAAAPELFEEVPARKPRSKRKRNIVMLATVLVFALVVTGSVYFVRALVKQFNPDDYPGPGGAAVEFTVQDGWGAKIISRKLEELDVISNDRLFIKAMDAADSEHNIIHPGEYELKKQMPAADAVEILVDNKPDKVFYIGLQANTRLDKALDEISEGSGLDREQLQKLAGSPQQFGLPKTVSNLEGWLHPGEYRMPLDTSAKDVLQEMVDATKKALSDAGINDLAQGYRTLNIASLLQAEARPKDYATVAGAINNRLQPGNSQTHGLLQIDSTVTYGLDRGGLQFSAAERQDASNPYNTYVHKGLPPTPIGSPATEAIEAAAHPESNNYYYWVTVNTTTGETKFSSNYNEHKVNQQEFRDWCQANPETC